MTKFLNTIKLVLDPNTPISNLPLASNQLVESVSIITNIVRADGIREITYGTVHENSGGATNEFITVEYITVGKNIADVTNQILPLMIGVVLEVLFVPLTIVGNTQTIAIIARSFPTGGSPDVNGVTTQKILLDDLISNEVVAAAGTVDGSFMAITAEFAQPNSTVSQGAKEAVLITVSLTE